MFDFHIHVSCSGGRDGLLPSEAMRLAKCAGYRAVGLIVRADVSTLPVLLPTLVPLVKTASLYAGIEAFAGAELVHVPPALLPDAVERARELGAALVLGHGESVPRHLTDVVETGTNLAAVRAGVDILAHPGLITPEDAELAAERGVLLELSTAPRHCLANGHVARMAERFGCGLVLGSDASTASDFESPEVTQALRKAAALGAGLDAEGLSRLHVTERPLVQKLLRP